MAASGAHTCGRSIAEVTRIGTITHTDGGDGSATTRDDEHLADLAGETLTFKITTSQAHCTRHRTRRANGHTDKGGIRRSAAGRADLGKVGQGEIT